MVRPLPLANPGSDTGVTVTKGWAPDHERFSASRFPSACFRAILFCAVCLEPLSLVNLLTCALHVRRSCESEFWSSGPLLKLYCDGWAPKMREWKSRILGTKQRAEISTPAFSAPIPRSMQSMKMQE